MLPGLLGIMITHGRETYQPTSIMRWDRGIFNGSGEWNLMPFTHLYTIDVPNSSKFPLVGWWIEVWRKPFNNRQMMIDGIPNRPLYFYQKNMIASHIIFSLMKWRWGASWRWDGEHDWMTMIWWRYLYTSHVFSLMKYDEMNGEVPEICHTSMDTMYILQSHLV